MPMTGDYYTTPEQNAKARQERADRIRAKQALLNERLAKLRVKSDAPEVLTTDNQ